MRTRAALLGLCLSALALAGCAELGWGSSNGSPATAASPTPATNGVDRKDAAAALKDAKEAFLTAASVHIKGGVTVEGTATTLDVQTGKGGISRGTVTRDGQTVRVITDGRYGYFFGDRAFWRDIAGKDAASFEGKYVKTKLTNKDFRGLVTLTDRRYVARMLPVAGLAFDGQERVAGVRTVRYKDFNGGGYNVALDGEPRPIQMAAKDGDHSIQLSFTDYGKPVDPTPPPPRQVIDLDKLPG